ncbi:MAG: MFS transporter [Clostridia bacterium]|nr:MFS transporter [Clostridia bacterium]
MKKYRATLTYASLQAFLWGIYAIVMSFASNYLLANGLNNAQISIVLGVSTAISIAVQLFLSEKVARNPEHKLWKILIGITLLMLVGCGMMFAWRVQPIAIAGYGLTCILLQTLPALGNSIGMDSIENGAEINYGFARGCGSLMFSLLSLGAGRVILNEDRYRVEILGAIVIALFGLSVLLFHFFGERERTNDPQKEQKRPTGNFLAKNKRFALFLVGCTLLLCNHNLLCNFMLQIMKAKNAGADAHIAQGTANSIGAILEIPAMLAFAWLLKLARCDRWLRISCVFFAAKCILIYLAPTAYWVYAAQVLQLAGFAVFSISSVYYAGKVAGEGEAVRAQAYLGSTTTIGSLFAMSTGGVICEYLGAQTMVLISAAMALLGAVIVFLSAEKIPQEET